MNVDVLLGLQWGDEGKGKIVDAIADQYDLICRFQGGPNAGHTIVIDGNKFVLHTIPSGVFRPNVINVIGNGVVVDPITLTRELEQLEAIGISSEKIYLARKAQLILPTHRLLDAASEASKGKEKIGSTLRGIGPTYMDKTGRNGLRTGDLENPKFREKYQALKTKHLQLSQLYPNIDFDLEKEEDAWFASLEKIKSLKMIDCAYFVNEAIDQGKKVLAEGAQGTMLDIDYGTYPFVTSSNTITAGVCTGLGVSPKQIGKVIGIVKAYTTRVGGGPFPTELLDETGEELRKIGSEFGATTGRPRRTGWLDIPQLRYAVMINGVDVLAITKVDCLNTFKTIKAATAYEIEGAQSEKLPYDINAKEITPVYSDFEGWNCELENTTYEDQPENLRSFLEYIEEVSKAKIAFVSTGPGRKSMFTKN